MLTALIVGVAFLTIDWLHSSASHAVEHPGPPATDEQIQTDTVQRAKDIVAIAKLAHPSAAYLLMSCSTGGGPPYQGAVYLDFTLAPEGGADAYFRAVAAALVVRGWKEGPPPNQHLFGRNLSKDGVSALLYPENASSTHGVARIHGPCRDSTDHRGGQGWIDVTDRLQ